jgi:hypothetical protein
MRSEEKSGSRKSIHDSGDESVAAGAVEAERLSGRDCVELPLQEAFRAMKACLDRGVADAQMAGRLGGAQTVDFAQQEHRPVAIRQSGKSRFQEHAQFLPIRLPLRIRRRGRCGFDHPVV